MNNDFDNIIPNPFFNSFNYGYNLLLNKRIKLLNNLKIFYYNLFKNNYYIKNGLIFVKKYTIIILMLLKKVSKKNKK